MARDIWQPIGAERPASWNLDRAGGTEKAFCCVNATARDFARVGQMLADQGYVAGRQVVPGAWVAHRGAGDDAAGRLGLFRAVVASGPR